MKNYENMIQNQKKKVCRNKHTDSTDTEISRQGIYKNVLLVRWKYFQEK